MFVDCGDRAIAASDVHMNAGKRSATAMMFSKETREMPERGTTKLRVVDPYEDEGIWAIVDEGANSNTHSDTWRKDADKKWKRLGFQSYLRNATITTFEGVGSKASSGKYQLPCGLRLEESYMTLPGGLSSHEMPNAKHPLLLSQSFQAKLGFQKDVRDGTITLKDYDGQSLEVVRQIRTGLFMVRIDHLDKKTYAEIEDQSLVKCLIQQPSLVTPGWGIAKDDDSQQAAHHAAIARWIETSPTPERADQDQHAYALTDVLEKDTIIVSCGMWNFEESNLSKGKCH